MRKQRLAEIEQRYNYGKFTQRDAYELITTVRRLQSAAEDRLNWDFEQAKKAKQRTDKSTLFLLAATIIITAFVGLAITGHVF